MSADIKLDGNNLFLEGAVVIKDSELLSVGSNSGYAFKDRKEPNTQRFVLYASEGTVRIWSDAESRDILWINKYGLQAYSGLGPQIKAPGGKASEPSENRSLDGVLKKLLEEVKDLKAKVKALEEKK